MLGPAPPADALQPDESSVNRSCNVIQTVVVDVTSADIIEVQVRQWLGEEV